MLSVTTEKRINIKYRDNKKKRNPRKRRFVIPRIRGELKIKGGLKKGRLGTVAFSRQARAARVTPPSTEPTWSVTTALLPLGDLQKSREGRCQEKKYICIYIRNGELITKLWTSG